MCPQGALQSHHSWGPRAPGWGWQVHRQLQATELEGHEGGGPGSSNRIWGLSWTTWRPERRAPQTGKLSPVNVGIWEQKGDRNVAGTASGAGEGWKIWDST